MPDSWADDIHKRIKTAKMLPSSIVKKDAYHYGARLFTISVLSKSIAAKSSDENNNEIAPGAE